MLAITGSKAKRPFFDRKAGMSCTSRNIAIIENMPQCRLEHLKLSEKESLGRIEIV
jgi:hypothetical protein